MYIKYRRSEIQYSIFWRFWESNIKIPYSKKKLPFDIQNYLLRHIPDLYLENYSIFIELMQLFWSVFTICFRLFICLWSIPWAKKSWKVKIVSLKHITEILDMINFVVVGKFVTFTGNFYPYRHNSLLQAIFTLTGNLHT